MYCPKCDQIFEEGSRRFCPTDGARLVSENDRLRGSREGGIFANLIPKMEAIADLDDTVPVPPKTINPEMKTPTTAEMSDDAFFELDLSDNEQAPQPTFIAEPPPQPGLIAAPAESLPQPASIRKIKPFEIPAGHVDLGDGYKQTNLAPEFDLDDPASFVGKTVKGRYKVEEFLGGDDNGLAFIADDKIVGDKKVLVRILDPDDPDEIVESMLAEERVSLSHFSHPNIARLIDSGQFTNGTHFLVSEFVDALSVNDILAIHGCLDGPRTARIIRQAANALSEAHQEGILHRDIRPENLIIDPSGDAEQIKVVNFGTSHGRPTEHNVGYKAPEILDRRIPTSASDIFSLGVVAYEMITGRLPFEGSTLKEFVRAQQDGSFPRISELKPGLSPAVDGVFERALAYNPAERYGKAREFGDALNAALADVPDEKGTQPQTPNEAHKPNYINVQPAAAPAAPRSPVQAPAAAKPESEPWRNRSPEPPVVGSTKVNKIFAFGIVGLLALVLVGWYFLMRSPSGGEIPAANTGDQVTAANEPPRSTITTDIEMPPLPRDIPQPPDTNYYQNTKQNLKGDLLINYVGFSLFYPKDWKVNGPKESTAANSRGKFLDISRNTADDRLLEQMLISYYPSKGTFSTDAEKFPQMVKETNETLKKLLPGYQMISEGEIRLNGGWKAYEVKFQGGGTSPTGEKLTVWGRRLFIPAARLGVRNGFEITMLATSLAEDIKSVDDVGVKGQLASVLYSFEPSQNF